MTFCHITMTICHIYLSNLDIISKILSYNSPKLVYTLSKYFIFSNSLLNVKYNISILFDLQISYFILSKFFLCSRLCL